MRVFAACRGPVQATKYKAPTNEVMLLPRFCWGQYLPGVDGPPYTIEGCGVWMNHYCPGLLLDSIER